MVCFQVHDESNHEVLDKACVQAPYRRPEPGDQQPEPGDRQPEPGDLYQHPGNDVKTSQESTAGADTQKPGRPMNMLCFDLCNEEA